MLYCARMIGTSTEEVAIPEPRRPARYFSPGFTVFCTVVVLVLMSLYAAPWRGSPLDQLERPAESLERLVTRDLDVRDALRSAPTWEQRLYTVLSGADDPVEEALRWYDELLEVVDSERAALYHAILQAEAGDPAPDDEQADEAVVAAYSPQSVAPEEASALITRVRATLPQNWFTDTLVARIARKVGDLPTAEGAEAAIVTRGRGLLGRWLGLTATELTLIGATIALPGVDLIKVCDEGARRHSTAGRGSPAAPLGICRRLRPGGARRARAAGPHPRDPARRPGRA